MRSSLICVVTACALVQGAFCANSANADLVGVWQFNNSLNNGVPGGAPMVALGGWAPTYVSETIGGNPATVLSFPTFTDVQALDMPNEAGPNGGSATTTNNWSIVMDVRFPAAGNFASLWEAQAVNTTDGDYFLRNNGRIGTSGQYNAAGFFVPSDWNRIAVTIDSVFNPGTYTVTGYVNGVPTGVVATTSVSPDGKEAVASFLHLFNDEDGENAAGLVNCVAYYDAVLSANDVAALGGANSSCIPEPASFALLGGALGLLPLVRGRRFSL